MYHKYIVLACLIVYQTVTMCGQDIDSGVDLTHQIPTIVGNRGLRYRSRHDYVRIKRTNLVTIIPIDVLFRKRSGSISATKTKRSFGSWKLNNIEVKIEK